MILTLTICAQNVSFKISLDSATLLMGKQTTLHMELNEPKTSGAGLFLIPADTLSAYVEISGSGTVDTIAGNDNRRIINSDLIIQSFDSGLYQIGPLSYLTADGDTVMSNPLSLKVVPVLVDSLETIHGDAPVFNVQSRWWDFIPDTFLDHYGLWLILLLCIILIIAGILLWLDYRKKGRLPFMPRPKPIPPYELAVSSLDNLKSRHLWEEGKEKEFYTELIDILRKYLEGRFGINAMEMTTSQIIRSLQSNEEINRHKDMMKEILDTADFVKFANMRPLPADNDAAWQDARKFVEDTRPIMEEGVDDTGKVAKEATDKKTKV